MNGEDKMKDCSDCKYFAGWDDSDGTPYCEYYKGIENCPYDNETKIKNNGIKAEYIDRKVLENVMAIMAANGTEKDFRVWARAISLLHDAPTVDVAPVIHGEWEPIINAYRELEGWICKRCGTEAKQKSNYCPNCGAKMDLEEQNNA